MPDSNVEKNKAAMRAFYQAFSDGNFDQLDDLMAREFVDHNPPPGVNATGRDAVKTMISDWKEAFPDLRFQVDRLIAEGDYVCAYCTVTGTHKGSLMGETPTGHSVTTHGIDFVKFSGGKAVERWGFGDEGQVLGDLFQGNRR